MHLAFCTPVGNQCEIGMGVHVDEPGRDHQSSDIQYFLGLFRLQCANRFNRCDHAVFDRDVAHKTICPGAIKNRAASQYHIVHWRIL